jgi:hypothetical protein
METKVFTTRQIWYRGYNYKCNYVVYYEIGSVFPKFGVISDFILLDEERCLLLLKEVVVEYFYRHLFAYKVIVTKGCFKLVDVKDLFIHESMELQQNCKLDGLYVISRYLL